MPKFISIYFFVILFTVNPYILNFIHLGLNLPFGNISYISFYPLFFLPIFLESNHHKKFEGIPILIGILLNLFAFYYYSFTFFWLGSLFICLSLLPYAQFKFGFLGYTIFLLTPPFSEKYTILIGFELRILLSKVSGLILQIYDSTTNVSGNIIYFRNIPYSIDPSCEGLKFFTGVILLFICFTHTYLIKNLTLWKIGISLSIGILAILLWIWANLVRILVLVLFSISDSSVFHFIIGIISFLCFVGLPFSLLWFRLIPENSISRTIHLEPNIEPNFKYPQNLILLLPILLSILILFRFNNFSYPSFEWKNNYGTFKREDKENNFESQFYRNKEATLILKKNLPIIGLGHHPKICFEAVGYEITAEEEIIFFDKESIRRAKIKLKNKEYFLSWWYVKDNGDYVRTASEWNWRINSVFNQNRYIQVNLITNTVQNAEKFYKELTKDKL